MPTQAHLFVGVPITSKADLLAAATHFGATPPPAVDQDDLQAWDDAFTSQITVEGKPLSLEIWCDDESGADWQSSAYANSITGQRGGSYTLLGVGLTSRYSPAIVDEGWIQGGRSEPFILDLDRLATILAAVKQQWPDAEILMMDYQH